MKQRLLMVGLVAGVALTVSAKDAHAWGEHHLVTRAALKDIPEIANATVTYSDFHQLLTKMGLVEPGEFNFTIQIRKDFRYLPHLNEVAGAEIPLIDVLAKYSDEPDWAMDTQLFEEGQYPELWKDEYAMMGGKTGTPSQAFRHMYWRGLDPLHPIRTFKMPFSRLFKGMGEAPERARVFVELSRRAAELGETYWAARFLSNSLHYLQDVASLFHSTQTPTKKFLWMPLSNPRLGIGFDRGFGGLVQQVTNIVSYYHFAFEDYIARLMNTETTTSEIESDLLWQALGDTSREHRKLRYRGDPVRIVKKMAGYSVNKSAPAARASIRFFPGIQSSYMALDAKAEQDALWWQETMELGKEDSRPKRRFFGLVLDVFQPMGFAIREWVTKELADQAATAEAR